MATLIAPTVGDRLERTVVNRQRPAIEITESDSSTEDVFDGLETPKLAGAGFRDGTHRGDTRHGHKNDETSHVSQQSRDRDGTANARSQHRSGRAGTGNKESASHRYQANKKRRCRLSDATPRRVRFASRRQIHVLHSEHRDNDDGGIRDSNGTRNNENDPPYPGPEHSPSFSPTAASCTVAKLPANLMPVAWLCRGTSNISDTCKKTLSYMITGHLGTTQSHTPDRTDPRRQQHQQQQQEQEHLPVRQHRRSASDGPFCGFSRSAVTETSMPMTSSVDVPVRNDRLKTQSSQLAGSPAFLENDVDDGGCRRGLLTPKLKTRRFETRKAAWDAVFQEQEQQNQSGIKDPDTIAEKYRRCCEMATQKARSLGLQDQEDAIAITSPARRSSRRPRRGRSRVRGI